MSKCRIIFEGDKYNPFIVLYKPHNIPTAPLTSDDTKSAFSYCAHFFPEIKKIQGKKSIEGGLLHRLDTGTEGLILIAKTQEAYERIAYFQMQGLFIKNYSAVCNRISIQETNLEGFPELPVEYQDAKLAPLIVETSFRHFGLKGAAVRPVYAQNGKIQRAALKKSTGTMYTTVLNECIENKTTPLTYTLDFELTRGFKHQIRAHSAWLGYPLVGDIIYNQKYTQDTAKTAKVDLQLCAYSFSFPHPITEKKVTFSL